jgi:hypothetical protein
MKARLTRTDTSDQGTFGILSIDDWWCYTVEPPWRGNKPQVSCIPRGEYRVQPWNSSRFPQTYNVMKVPNRAAILKHQGNLAGDASKGYLRHSLGCILVGKKRGWIGKQKAVLLSVVAMRELREKVGRKCFDLEIEGVAG